MAVNIGSLDGDSEHHTSSERLSCAVCSEDPCACHHTGCLHCLHKKQKSSSLPSDPVCEASVDRNHGLALNANLRHSAALHGAQALEAIVGTAEAHHGRLAAIAAAAQLSLEDCERQRKFFFYSAPLPEETGHWIPVSVPPVCEKDVLGVEDGIHDGGLFPEDFEWMEQKGVPELTMWSVMTELLAVACGTWNQRGSTRLPKEFPAKEWDRVEERDAFDPCASVLFDEMEDHLRSMQAVLAAEPPYWIPDSASSTCMQCHLRFYPITFRRHHCRLCGGLFCGSCSTGRSLLPEKFREGTLQRVCGSCCEKLEPVQGILIEQVSHSSQSATHDVTDLSCMMSWINCPVGISMEHEIYKATNTVRSYLEVGKFKPERCIPDAVLKGAKGLAIITVLKAGMMFTSKIGTGLVVARKQDGSWSAPSAIALCGIGLGAQVGGEITDFIIVLHNEAAVKIFGRKAHFSLGLGLSIAAGPVGRTAEVNICTGDGDTAACYTYSRSKGVFMGCSLEGSVVITRTATNIEFYGDPSINAADILYGSTRRPKAASILYKALADLFKLFD